MSKEISKESNAEINGALNRFAKQEYKNKEDQDADAHKLAKAYMELVPTSTHLNKTCENIIREFSRDPNKEVEFLNKERVDDRSNKEIQDELKYFSLMAMKCALDQSTKIIKGIEVLHEDIPQEEQPSLEEKPCVLCQKMLKSAVYDWKYFQPVNGGEIRFIFGYGSKFDMNGFKTESFRGIVCDECAEKAILLMERVS